MVDAKSATQHSSGYPSLADSAHPKASHGGFIHNVEHEAGEGKGLALRAFNKFNNDWTMNLVSMVAYNLLTSFFPLILAMITILALLPSISGNTASVVSQINSILPGDVRKQINVASLIHSVNNQFGLLTLVSIVGLLWGGTNLFGSIESAFAVIFRVKTRDILPQKLMSVVMILLFVILLPISFVASFLFSSASSTLGRILPSFMTGPLSIILALATGLVALFVLFLAMYTVIPNIAIRWRYAWRGALVAAVAMWIVNTAFPIYTSHFVSTKQYSQAAIAGAVITITWFWFFSLILLVGAQVNSLAMGIGYWKYDLTRTLMNAQIPTEGGVPTAVDALEQTRNPELLDSPLGLARDSQGALQSSQSDGNTPKAGISAKNTPAASASAMADRARQMENASKQQQKEAGKQARHATVKHQDKHDAHKPDHNTPRAADQMPDDLVATGIATGGVSMAGEEETLGPRTARTGLIVAGAAVGLLSALAHRSDEEKQPKA